jgi:hypothetical protein
MLLALDVDTEKALHSRNHVAYRSLHRLKTVFHNVFILKWCLSTHDDMQGANKVRTKGAVSRRAGSTSRLSNYREEQDQQGDREEQDQQADRRMRAHTHTQRD